MNILCVSSTCATDGNATRICVSYHVVTDWLTAVGSNGERKSDKCRKKTNESEINNSWAIQLFCCAFSESQKLIHCSELWGPTQSILETKLKTIPNRRGIPLAFFIDPCIVRMKMNTKNQSIVCVRCNYACMSWSPGRLDSTVEWGPCVCFIFTSFSIIHSMSLRSTFQFDGRIYLCAAECWTYVRATTQPMVKAHRIYFFSLPRLRVSLPMFIYLTLLLRF